MEVTIVQADLQSLDHRRAIVDLVDAYSADQMGAGERLSEFARLHLIAALEANPTTIVLLAMHDEQAIGIAICFRGVSTFAAKPVLNIHDLSVLQTHRGQGVGRMLLMAVEQKARKLGCCKVTLEVLEANRVAKGLYASCGFESPSGATHGCATLFLNKSL